MLNNFRKILNKFKAFPNKLFFFNIVLTLKKYLKIRAVLKHFRSNISKNFVMNYLKKLMEKLKNFSNLLEKL